MRSVPALSAIQTQSSRQASNMVGPFPANAPIVGVLT